VYIYPADERYIAEFLEWIARVIDAWGCYSGPPHTALAKRPQRPSRLELIHRHDEYVRCMSNTGSVCSTIENARLSWSVQVLSHVGKGDLARLSTVSKLWYGSARDTTGQSSLNLRTWTSMSAPSSSSGPDSLSSEDKRPCAFVYCIQAVVLGVRQTLVGHLLSTWEPAAQ
jgi:hypothetical protein